MDQLEYLLRDQIGVGNRKKTTQSFQDRTNGFYYADRNQIVKNITYVEHNGIIEGKGASVRLDVKANMHQFIDTRNMRLVTTFQLVQQKEGETEPTKLDGNEAKHVSFIDNIGASYIRAVETQINNAGFSDLTKEDYDQTARLETLLSKSPREIDALSIQGFNPDVPGFFESTNYVDNSAAVTPAVFADGGGFYSRQALANEDGQITTVAPLYVDWATSPVYLPPGFGFVFILHTHIHRNKYLMLVNKERPTLTIPATQTTAGTTPARVQFIDYGLQLLSVKLIVPFVELNDREHVHRMQYLAAHTYSRVYEKIDVRTKQMPANLQNFTFDLGITENHPKVIVIVIHKTSNLQDDYRKSPFVYEHANMKQICLRINNVQFPLNPVTSVFDKAAKNRNYVEAYVEAMMNIGKTYDTAYHNFIDYNAYGNDYTFWAFDLTRDKSACRFIQDNDTGTIEVDVKLHSPLTENHTMKIYTFSEYSLNIIPLPQKGIKIETGPLSNST